MNPTPKMTRNIAQLDRGPLKRVLEVRDLFAIGYGDLGSSIYYALGVTALYALGATPIALGIAGLIFVCTALTYAEMSSALHESGGSASFARHAFNDLISFIAGWGLLLDYIVTIAISAFAIAPYLAFMTPLFKATWVQIGFTIGLIAVLLVINFFGVKHSTRMSLILTTFTLLTQVIIIFIGGFWVLDLTTVFDQMRIGVANVDWSPSWPEFWKGTAMAMVAYTGIESIAQLGSETRNPAKTLPRACLRVMWVLLLMYIGISVVALSTMSPKVLGTTYVQDPIAGIVKNLPLAEILGPWVGILAALLLFVAANAGLMGASRLAFNMGEYYQLPRFFYRIHSTYRTPIISLAFFAILASVVVIWSRGKLDFLADLYNFGAMIAFCSAHVSLVVLRIKKPELARPFRAPFNLKIKGHSISITAVIGALATFAVWCLIIITKPEGRYLGLVWMTFGIAMYLIYRRRKQITPTAQLTIEKVKIPGFEPIVIKNILVPIKGGKQTETLQIACKLAKLYNAKLTAIHIIEVPFSVPIDAPMPYRALIGQTILQQAEALGREMNVAIELQMVYSRSIDESVLEILKDGKYDLLVMGAIQSERQKAKGLGPIVDRIVRASPCRVWICTR